MVSFFWAVPGLTCAQVQVQVKDNPQPAPSAQDVVIPDGTRLELRFAQGVWAKAAGQTPTSLPDGVSGEAQRGDVIRLIATANLRIDGRVFLPRAPLDTPLSLISWPLY